MADNIGIRSSAASDAKQVAADDIGGVLYQLIKLTYGADGQASMVSTTSPFPVTAVESGTYAYAAGTGDATVDIPAGGRVRRVSVVANAASATTVTIAGGNTITIPAGGAFDEQIPGQATLGGDVVIGGGDSQSYYVSWTA